MGRVVGSRDPGQLKNEQFRKHGQMIIGENLEVTISPCPCYSDLFDTMEFCSLDFFHSSVEAIC